MTSIFLDYTLEEKKYGWLFIITRAPDISGSKSFCKKEYNLLSWKLSGKLSHPLISLSHFKKLICRNGKCSIHEVTSISIYQTLSHDSRVVSYCQSIFNNESLFQLSDVPFLCQYQKVINIFSGRREQFIRKTFVSNMGCPFHMSSSLGGSFSQIHSLQRFNLCLEQEKIQNAPKLINNNFAVSSTPIKAVQINK